MVDQKDEDLEKVRRKKLEDLMKGISERTKKTGTPLQASDKPIELTDDTFYNFTENNNLAVIDCWAPWCGPCRFLTPVVEELARDYQGRIAFGKLNVDENQRVARQYGIMSIPTLLIFKNGKMVDQLIGAMPRNMLEPRITIHM
jgi:thioredoxin 1